VEKHFLGRGWGFPIKPGPNRQMAYVSGPEKIRQSIWLILSTSPGERQMRPEFGCGIHDLVFQPNTASLRSQVQSQVREALTRWESRIDLLDVRVEAPAERRNTLEIRIEYRIRSTNAHFNLVYPFFINEGAG
jgi:uncharacterized protein